MHPVPLARPRAGALVVAAIAFTLSAAAFGTVLGPGEKDCPDSPSRWRPTGHAPGHELLDAYDAFDAMLLPDVMPRQLLPGTRRATPGVPMTGHLAGTTIVTESVNFSFFSKDGHVVTGTLNTSVVDADCTCDFYWWIEVLGGSWLGIDQVIIKNFPHPTHQLYAAWRNDELPLGIPPDHAQRSPGAGTTIIFKFAAVVQPGQDSRAMLLDSDVGVAQKTATLQLRATDGSLSAPILTWAPKWP